MFALSGDAAAVVIGATLALLLFGALLVGLVFVIRDTVRGKGRWGVNTKQAVCPECGTPAPIFRRPKNRQQALWGGWTCEECGLELDKWGEPVDEADAERLNRSRGRKKARKPKKSRDERTNDD